MTGNVPVVHVSGGTVNQVETSAWGERFGENILYFRRPLSNPDKRYKTWFQCTRCYSHWVLGSTEPHALNAAAAPCSPEVTTEQQAMIHQNRAEAVRRRAAAEALASAPGGSMEEEEEPDPFGLGGSMDVEEEDMPPAKASPCTPAKPPAGPLAASPRSRSGRSRGGGADARPSGVAMALPPVPPLPIAAAACTEPLRELNLYLQRRQMDGAQFSFLPVDAAAGAWQCEASAGGISARGSGRGKAAAKREAAGELLRGLRGLA